MPIGGVFLVESGGGFLVVSILAGGLTADGWLSSAVAITPIRVINPRILTPEPRGGAVNGRHRRGLTSSRRRPRPRY